MYTSEWKVINNNNNKNESDNVDMIDKKVQSTAEFCKRHDKWLRLNLTECRTTTGDAVRKLEGNLVSQLTRTEKNMLRDNQQCIGMHHSAM